jgi:hypothetical protein
MIEFFFFVALLFLIAILFYKQRRPELTILQLEATQVAEQLVDLLDERQPLVIRSAPPPKGLTLADLQKITRLQGFQVGGHPLSKILAEPSMLGTAAGVPTMSLEARQDFAKELAMPVWASHTWLPAFSASTWFGWALGTMRTEAVLGGLGLFRTTAAWTCLIPTEGKYTVSLLTKASEDYLPAAWEYRYPSSFTVNDTPMVANLKYLDVVVRVGTMICVPPHTIVAMEPAAADAGTAFHAALIMEYHEPITMLAKSVS